MIFSESSDKLGSPDSMDDETKQIVAAAVKNTNVWYKATETIINNRLNALAIKAVDSSGNIQSSSLNAEDKSFLNRYVKSNEEWEELSVIVAHDGKGIKAENGESVSLTINRPLSVGISDR
jgi:ribosomal protein L28